MNWVFSPTFREWHTITQGFGKFRIHVDRDGMFDPSSSDEKLLPPGEPIPTFATLSDAKAWCAGVHCLMQPATQSV